MRRRELLLSVAAFAATGARAAEGGPQAIRTFEAESGGHFGLYAENTQDGRRIAWRADDRFVMCSSFKASLAALILRRVDHRTDNLADSIAFGPDDMQDWYAPVARANLVKGSMTVGDMCAAAVEHSDNTCASLLLKRVGGPAAVTTFWRSLGDDVSRLDDPEPILNRTPPGGVRDTTTPRAMAATFGKLTLGGVLSPASRDTLNGWLIANTTGDDRLRAGLPGAWVKGDKTGNNGGDAAIDLAVAWAPHAPIVIAAFTRGGSPTAAQFREVFRAVGELAASKLA
jgi:beta-lactamase class A